MGKKSKRNKRKASKVVNASNKGLVTAAASKAVDGNVTEDPVAASRDVVQSTENELKLQQNQQQHADGMQSNHSTKLEVLKSNRSSEATKETQNSLYPWYRVQQETVEMVAKRELERLSCNSNANDTSCPRNELEIVTILVEQSRKTTDSYNGVLKAPAQPFVSVSRSWLMHWNEWADQEYSAKYRKLNNTEPQHPPRTVEKPSKIPRTKPDEPVEWIPYSAYNALKHWYGSESDSPIVQSSHQLFKASAKSTEVSKLLEVSHNETNDVESFVQDSLKQVGVFQSHWDYSWHEPAEDNECVVCESTGKLFYCESCKSVKYCSKECQASHWKYHKPDCLSGRAPKWEARRGRTGLSNLGNTCFMSSAVQCLSHTWPLTRYFLQLKFRKDLNKENPMGSGGNLAMVWYTLMQEMWLDVEPTVSPYQLKSAIGSLPGSANRFEGYQQHDAQELLAMLLDTLHEDLNLVLKKEYFEAKENDTRPTQVQAAEAWVNTWKRDCSMVASLFQGLLQSTLECPHCSHRSVSFESFFSLPLALPDITLRVLRVTVVHCSPSTSITLSEEETGFGRRTRYAISLPGNSTCAKLKEELVNVAGIGMDTIWLVEVLESHVEKQLDDSVPISQIMDDDVIVAYEIPETTTYDDVAPFLSSNIVVLNSLGKPKVGGGVATSLVHCGFPFVIQISGIESVNSIRNRIILHSIAIGQLRTSKQQTDTTSCKSMADARVKATQLGIDPSQVCIRLVKHNGDPLDDVPPLLMGSDVLPDHSTDSFARLVGSTVRSQLHFVSVDWSTDSSLGQVLKHPDAQENQSFNQWPIYESVLQRDDVSVQELAQGPAQGTGVSLQRCLSNFLCRERLDQGNLWKCDGCKSNQRAWKVMNLVRLPRVLVICLKRFDNSAANVNSFRSHGKLGTLVTFPIRGLDLSQLLPSDTYRSASTTATSAVYDLYGVINHYGSMGYGHYTAVVASAMDSSSTECAWYEVDDDKVIDRQESDVCSSAAYVLFYRLRC